MPAVSSKGDTIQPIANINKKKKFCKQLIRLLCLNYVTML